MLTRIKIYFQLLVNQSVSKTSETTNRMIFTQTKILVHFYKKFQDIIIIFHDFPRPWLFSMTFQAWKMVLLNSMTFQEEWSPCINKKLQNAFVELKERNIITSIMPDTKYM